ncbi:MAG: hypothetical protein IJ985_04860 [Akkermansia sp.]|nr:hypothetical protein [Akkermansia sp.]
MSRYRRLALCVLFLCMLSLIACRGVCAHACEHHTEQELFVCSASTQGCLHHDAEGCHHHQDKHHQHLLIGIRSERNLRSKTLPLLIVHAERTDVCVPSPRAPAGKLVFAPTPEHWGIPPTLWHRPMLI